MNYAPIIIFAFNRLTSLQNTVTALQQNSESKESDLFIFVDGARPNKDQEKYEVKAVCDFAKKIRGFKSLQYHFSTHNQGLGPSIIAGVSAVINLYGKAIIVEDDLIVSSNFLSFMNQGLNQYIKEQKVFSICGYSNRLNIPADYHYDTYFCTRSSSWGWATWSDRWNSVDWELEDWNSYKKYRYKFNSWGGSDCWKMLNDWHYGRNKSWAIRFCFAQFLQNKLSLFPLKSKVKNDGFDGKGTNCKKWSRFKNDFDNTCMKSFSYPISFEVNRKLLKSSKKYSSIAIRVWSKIMYILYR